MAIPASQKAIRRIAIRQGILFGGIVGMLIVIFVVGSTLLSLWHLDGFYPRYLVGLFGLAPLSAFVAFFLAGLRTAKKTGRVEMGALAGFWAAIAVSFLGIGAMLLQNVIQFGGYFGDTGFYPRTIWNMGFITLYVMAAYLIVALLLGTAIGVLGGFIGKAYANDVPPIQSMPPLYMYNTPTQSAEPPYMPPQN